jgi:hypothetical protein
MKCQEKKPLLLTFKSQKKTNYNNSYISVYENREMENT